MAIHKDLMMVELGYLRKYDLVIIRHYFLLFYMFSLEI